MEVTDFPEPDSPTRAMVRFLGISKLMPLMAWKGSPSSMRKATFRFWTETRGVGSVITSPSDPGRRAGCP